MGRGGSARALIGLAALLAGAAGTGLETVLLAAAGLALGQGRATAFGLGVFVAGWALGAWLAGRRRGRPDRDLMSAAAGVAVASLAVPAALFALARAGASGWPAAAAGLLGLALAALPQGMLFPLLVRARDAVDARVRTGVERGIGALFAANLLGSVGGALLLGHALVARSGRPLAAAASGACALAAGLVAAAVCRRAIAERAEDGRVVGALHRERVEVHAGSMTVAAAGWTIGLATLWMVSLEWILLRIGVLWVGSAQLALSALLAASLAALALGAALLPPLVPRDERGPLAVLALAALASAWPLVAAPALEVGLEQGRLVALATLVVPALVPFGAVLPVVHRCLRGEGGRRVGGLLLHESWGALAAGPLVHVLLVPAFGLRGAIAALMLVGPLAAGPLLRSGWRVLPAALVPLLLAAWAALRAGEPALASPPLSDPAFAVRSFTEDGEFAVTVVDDGLVGERTLLTDHFRAAGTGRDYMYMQALGHLPLLLHPAPRRVAVLALGTGTTLGSVALHDEVERIDVLEISRAVVEQAPWFADKHRGALDEGLPGLLDAGDGRARVVVRLGDGRRTLLADGPVYDVVTMEPLLPSSPFGVTLYTREFYARARLALAPGGLLCQWIPPHALAPAHFDAVLAAVAEAFPWTGVWLFGTQVLVVGAASEPGLERERFEDLPEDLLEALIRLDLDVSEGVLARFLFAGSAWPPAVRPLTDADPWIVFGGERAPLELLLDLPRNLERMLRYAHAAPAHWPEGAPVYRLAHADLREARLAHARREAALRGAYGDPEHLRTTRDEHLARARRSPLLTVVAFEEEVAFLEATRRGVALLAASEDVGAARAALDDLVRAAELRPERSDVHLYVACALNRMGVERGVEPVLEKALGICPRLAETPAGKRAVADLGLPASALRP